MRRLDIGWYMAFATATLLVGGTAAGSDTVGERLEWQTDSGRVRLVADALEITANRRVFTASDAVVTVHGDPGDGLYWTLEAAWREQGVPMRLFVYFTSDGTDWWATSIRTYDGTALGDWIVYEGQFFRTPLGKPFTGELDLTDPDRGCGLRIANLRIETSP